MLIPPQSLDIERSLIASILYNTENACEAFIKIQDNDFYSNSNMIIFATLKKMFEKEIPFNELTLIEILKNRGELERAGGEGYIQELCNSIASSTSIQHFIEVIKHKSMARKLISACSEISNIAYSSEDKDELISESNKIFYESTREAENMSTVRIGDMIPEEVKRCVEREYNTISGISSGFNGIDIITAGFQLKDLIIIGGRPSNGKTSLALIMMMNIAENGFPCVYFTLESNKSALIKRIIALKSKINLIKTRRGCMSDEEKTTFSSVGNSICGLPIFIDESYGLSVNDLHAKTRLLKIKNNIQVVFIDYLQLFNKEIYGKNLSTADKTGLVSRGLKNIGKELDMPIIALSQLHRLEKTFKKKNHRPSLDTLRDSGAIEQDADVVMLVHREELYNEDDDTLKGKAEVNIAKQRDGPIGIVDFGFEKSCARFYELDKEGW
jgi:replicative DNA helicase